MQQKRHSARDEDSDGPVAHADEHAVIAGLREGDVATFRHLMNKYWQPLVAYAYSMLNSQDAAEDAVQEAFIRLWQRRSETRPQHSLRGYLFGIVRHVVTDVRRKGQIREGALARSHVTAPNPPTPAEVAELGMLETAVIQAIEELPERRREVFRLAHYSGLSHQEIGEVLGITASTAKKHVNLALGDLRRLLQPHLDRTLTLRRR